MSEARFRIAVVGGGPAGLRAAEIAAGAGAEVTLFDAKPSVGRKLLVAGRGGLNITHSEAFDRFIGRYSGPPQPAGIWGDLLANFDATDLRAWAAGLGIETFRASNGRIYPLEMKAAPLLRRWIERLRGLGVHFAMQHRLTGLRKGKHWGLSFANEHCEFADAVILALGGGSWPKTGSDGAWVEILAGLAIACHPLMPANCGWECEWPQEMLAVAEGLPLKNLQVSANHLTVSGELLITRYGLEGGAIYQLGAVLRTMRKPAVAIDFKPDFSAAQLVRKMESARGDLLAHAAERWKLSAGAVAILGSRAWDGVEELADLTKHCVIPFSGPRPIDEAISSAGGVCWDEIDPATLMVRKHPGLFVAGEMIDWEAPTGGYLMQGCFATGMRAGQGAVDYCRGAPVTAQRVIERPMDTDEEG